MSIDIINIDPEIRQACNVCGQELRWSIWFELAYCPVCEPMFPEEVAA